MAKKPDGWKSFTLHRTPDKQCLILTFNESDLRSSVLVRTIEHDFARLPGQYEKSRIVLDFQDIRIVPTAIFGLVLQLVVELRDAGVQARLSGMAPPVRKAFTFLNAKGLVEVFDSRKEAVKTPWDRNRTWWKFW